MRWSPLGRTCIRKRRMNSSVASVMRLYRAAVGAVVLVPEGDAMLVERDQPAIGDGDAVGVARQIGEHRLGSAERGLCINVPLDPAQRRQVGREGLALGEVSMLAEECEPAGLVGGEELGK